ncbi:MAG: glycosyltransferase [Betaproteobacteria bacterium]|nr:glycosyltransferase [Betaproteobacteria bacterium]
MKVLHLGKYYPPYRGGMESFLADLMAGLEGQGIANAALVHGDGQQAGGQWEGAGPKILRAPSHGRLLYAPLSPRFPGYLDRAIREFAPDILHIHMPNPSAFWALGSRVARRLPWVVHWHADVLTPESSMPIRLAYRPYSVFESAMLRRAAAVIASSPDYLNASAPLAPYLDKCVVIPLGLADSRLPQPRPEQAAGAAAHWPAGCTLKILMIGRFTYYKGHRVLIDALSRVPAAAAVLVGGGETEADVAAQASRLGLADRVLFAGNVAEAELAGVLAAADVLCLPAIDRAEAFGVVLLEAMRFEKPLIASNIRGSGVPWVLDQCDCGLAVQSGDAEGLAAAIRWMADHPEQRMEMGRCGTAAYRKIFKIEAVADKVAALYRRVLA